jgi:ribosomal protein S18 acetylase RimI-like enzyme
VNTALRPCTAADGEFVYHVAETTARGLVESQGRKWAAGRMRERSESDAADPASRGIVVDGEDAGFFKVEVRSAEIWLDALLLLPRFHKRGIGSSLVAQVHRDSSSRQLPIRLGVYHANPAKTFWKRQGFVVRSESEQHYWMERPA